MPLRLSVVKRALLNHTFQTSEQLPDSVSAPSTNHKPQGRRTEVFRQTTKQKASVRVHTWACGRERSFEERTDGKSVSRVHTLRAARNKHDWTCTVPWHVFQRCVRTLQMTMTTTHLGMVIEQTSGDPCAMARVPSKQATHNPRTKTRDFKMESQRQKIPNHEPLKVANKATGHTSQPESLE